MTEPARLIFPDSARRQQVLRGSRNLYAGRDDPGGFPTRVDARLAAFLLQVDSFFIASATADAKPYIQHRGGPKGFLRPLDDATLGFADFAGNRQYITLGRLTENDAVCLFLIDYVRPARIKLWGRARFVEGDAALLARLVVPGYRAKVERAILIDIEAWDVNCPQHIPLKLPAEDVADAVDRLEARIAELEAENARLKEIAR